MAQVDVGRLELDVADIKVSVDRLEQGQAALSERMARLEGAFEGAFGQMNERMGDLGARLGSLEQTQRWVLGLLFGLWLTTILAVLGLYFKGAL